MEFCEYAVPRLVPKKVNSGKQALDDDGVHSM